jgi:hypothetical protein
VLAEVGDDDERVGQAPLAKARAAHAPAAGAAGKGAAEHARAFTGEAVGEAEIGGLAAEDALGGLGDEFLAGAVDEAEGGVGIEGEDGDIDLLHDGAEEGGGLEGAEALFLEDAAEEVDFGQDIAEGLVAVGAAGARGEIALAQRGEEIGHRLQRADDVLPHGEGEAEPAENDDQPGGSIAPSVRRCAPRAARGC